MVIQHIEEYWNEVLKEQMGNHLSYFEDLKKIGRV
jgi:hypothetical protein